MKHIVFGAASILSLSLAFPLGEAVAQAKKPGVTAEPYKTQLDALRKAMEKYQDYKVAVRDLYLSTVGCVHYSGEKIPGHMEYAKAEWACIL